MPFGLSFSLLWLDVGMQSQWVLFTCYTLSRSAHARTRTALAERRGAA